MKLAKKVPLLFLLLVLLPVVGLALVAVRVAGNSMESGVLAHLHSVNSLRRDAFERWLDQNAQTVSLVSQRPLLKEDAAQLTALDRDDPYADVIRDRVVKTHLGPLNDQVQSIQVASLINTAGIIVASTEPSLERRDVRKQEFFIQGLTHTFIDNARYSAIENKVVLHVSTPMVDRSGNITGVLATHLNMATLSMIMGQSPGYQTEDTYLVNAAGTYTSDPVFGAGYALSRSTNTTAVNQCLTGQGSDSAVYPNYQGAMVMGVYHWLPEQRLCIITEVHQAEVMAPITRLRRTIAVFAFGIAITALALGWLASRGIVRPLSRVVAGTLQLRHGNLDYRIAMTSRDEFGQLASAFDAMADQLQERTNENARRLRLVTVLSRTAADLLAAHSETLVHDIVGRQISALGYSSLLFELSADTTVLHMVHSVIRPALIAEIEEWVGGPAEANYDIAHDPGQVYERTISLGEPIFFPEAADILAVLLPPDLAPLAPRIASMRGQRAGVLAPMATDGAVHGLILIIGPDLDQADLPGFALFGSQIASRIENLRLTENVANHALALERRVAERTAELSIAVSALSDSERRYRSTFENAGIGMASLTTEGQYIDVNEQFCAITGYARDELLGLSCLNIAHPEDRDLASAELDTVRQGLSPVVVTQYRVRRKDAATIWVERSVSAHRDEQGAFIHFIAALKDVTEAKQTLDDLSQTITALRVSNEELEQFAHVASHDLQEPLRMVSSYVQLLARRYRGQLDADADEFITFAVDGAQRMSQLITDILTYSRLKADGDIMKPMRSESALTQALAVLQESIEARGAIVTYDELPEVLGDLPQITQVFMNLVANGIKYNQDPAPHVHVSAQRQDGHWRFAVKDNGIGIEAQYFGRVFVIFQRLHSKEEYSGTGIGLAICRRIIHNHHGQIWLESEPNHGTTFLFTLPDANRK